LLFERSKGFRAFYVDVLEYRERTPVIHDPVQTAFVQFFSIPGSDHYIELVRPASCAKRPARESR
jgi:hypothetical protein